jgi:dTDP-4-dehydrorhamnose 3,5-epimerase
MRISPLAIPDVLLIAPKVLDDERGVFCEVYSRPRFREAGLDVDFVQDNVSISRLAGTVRGLHFQLPPFDQSKLVRVTRGSIYDVAVDLRRGQPGFGRHVGAVLRAGDWTQMYIPTGFAHGFCTLEDDTEVSYKVTAPYAPRHDRTLLWNDPVLGIDWPVAAGAAILSAKDRTAPDLAGLVDAF